MQPHVDEGVRTTLLKIKMMRNLFAHRAGRADERFLGGWPEYPLSVGEIVNPTATQVVAAYTAMVLCVESIQDRMLGELGMAPPKRKLPPWINAPDDLIEMLAPDTSSPARTAWTHHYPGVPSSLRDEL